MIPVLETGFVQPEIRQPHRVIGARTVDFDRELLTMAVVNRTPDSFYDRGRTFALDAAVAAGVRAVADGAEWVDVGGVPFAPGDPLPARTEAQRVVPVIEQIVQQCPETIVSVDTFHASVAQRCLAAGASVVNDTTGLSDPRMAAVVAEHGAHVVLTHSLARPRTAYPAPRYSDVTREVLERLRRLVDRAQSAGIDLGHLMVDPGHDLNKNTLHSLELTRRLREITALGLPTLVAVSNKDFVGETLQLPRGERTEGSLAAAVLCAAAGARVFRMHDAKAAHRALAMTAAVLGLRSPRGLEHNMAPAQEVER